MGILEKRIIHKKTLSCLGNSKVLLIMLLLISFKAVHISLQHGMLRLVKSEAFFLWHQIKNKLFIPRLNTIFSYRNLKKYIYMYCINIVYSSSSRHMEKGKNTKYRFLHNIIKNIRNIFYATYNHNMFVFYDWPLHRYFITSTKEDKFLPEFII